MAGAAPRAAEQAALEPLGIALEQEIILGATALTIPGEMAQTRMVHPAGRMASLAQVVALEEAEPVVVGQEAAQEAVAGPAVVAAVVVEITAEYFSDDNRDG